MLIQMRHSQILQTSMQCLPLLLVQHISLPPFFRVLLFLKVHVCLFHQCELSLDIHVCCWVWQCAVMVMASCLWSGSVYLRHDLNFSQYVESVVATYNQRLYLLAQLKKQGFGISTIDTIFKAIVLSRILYALPDYFGYFTEGQKQMLQQMLHGASYRGFSPYYYDFDTLAEKAQYDFFHHSCHARSF